MHTLMARGVKPIISVVSEATAAAYSAVSRIKGLKLMPGQKILLSVGMFPACLAMPGNNDSDASDAHDMSGVGVRARHQPQDHHDAGREAERVDQDRAGESSGLRMASRASGH